MSPSLQALLPPGPLLAAFVIASLVLAITPGPGVLYIVARSIAEGRASALASVGGVALGNLANALGAALGLAALFAASAEAFAVVKYAGALYLLWLGIRCFRPVPERPSRAQEPSAAQPPATARAASVVRAPSAARAAPDAASPDRAVSLRRVFTDGLVVALLNPKTTLFFAAFLPQFVGDSPMAAWHSVMLGIVFVVIAALTDTIWALGAAALPAGRLRGPRAARVGRWSSGIVYVALGVLAATGERARR